MKKKRDVAWAAFPHPTLPPPSHHSHRFLCRSLARSLARSLSHTISHYFVSGTPMNANPVFFPAISYLITYERRVSCYSQAGQVRGFSPSGSLLQLTHHPSCLGLLWGLHDHTAAVLLLRLRIEHLTLRTQSVGLGDQTIDFLASLQYRFDGFV